MLEIESKSRGRVYKVKTFGTIHTINPEEIYKYMSDSNYHTLYQFLNLICIWIDS
jgi:hypothetical protein